MTYSDEQIRSLVQRADQRERAARRRAILYSLIPIALAALLLWFTSWLVQRTTRELDVVNEQLDTSQQELTTVNTQLTQANAQVSGARQELTAAEGQLAQADAEITTLETEKAALQEQASTYQEEAEKLRKEADKLQGQVDDLKKQVDQLNQSLESVTEQLKLATDFKRYAYTGDWTLAVKHIASNYLDQSTILLDLYDMQNVPWKLGGESPEEGFDSPGFAAYVLDTHGLLNVPISSARYQRQLRQVIPARSGSPKIGDLVFYALGYTMFYFEDERGTPFVVGMTPVGVLALRPDFAEVIGYGAVY